MPTGDLACQADLLPPTPTHEVETRDGTTVWEWVSEPYDESSVPEVAKARRYDLDSKQGGSWPCSQFDSAI